MIAAVTDAAGGICGIHRTWLDPQAIGEKAPVKNPRRSLGDLLGFGVRFGASPGVSTPILIAGEGLATMMSLRVAMPAMPMVAGLSSNHLAAILFPPSLGRLYIAEDADFSGRRATARLSERARRAGIEALKLSPKLGDFNEDLRRLGREGLVRGLRDQLLPGDGARFLLEA